MHHLLYSAVIYQPITSRYICCYSTNSPVLWHNKSVDKDPISFISDHIIHNLQQTEGCCLLVWWPVPAGLLLCCWLHGSSVIAPPLMDEGPCEDQLVDRWRTVTVRMQLYPSERKIELVFGGVFADFEAVKSPWHGKRYLSVCADRVGGGGWRRMEGWGWDVVGESCEVSQTTPESCLNHQSWMN